MTTAEAANEYRYNTGSDNSILDALDPEYLDTEAPARRYFDNSGELETFAEHTRWCEGCPQCW
jgi:hypothetical protein